MSQKTEQDPRRILRRLMALDIARYVSRHEEWSEERRKTLLARLTSPLNLDRWLDVVISEEIRDRVEDAGSVPDSLLRLARPTARA